MRILFFTHGADMMGANRCLLDLLLVLKTKGIEPIVALPADGVFKQVLEKEGIPSTFIPYKNWAFTKYISKGYWKNGSYHRHNLKNVKQWAALLAKEKIDLLYSNTSLVGIGAMLAEALGKPHVWHIREFGEADYNQAFYKGRSYFSQWANKSKLIISMSEAIRQEVLLKLQPKITVVHDGIFFKNNPPQFLAEKANIFTFLIIGLIHPTKGQFKALKAFHKLKQRGLAAKLNIVGKGRRLYMRKMKNYVKRYGLEDDVNFLGYVSDPWKVHAESSALLMCSRSEGMGRVTLESMYVGNPVLGYNAGGTKELVATGTDGFLFDDFEEELPNRMQELIENPELCQRLGKAGREKVLAQYTVENSAEKIEALLKGLA